MTAVVTFSAPTSVKEADAVFKQLNDLANEMSLDAAPYIRRASGVEINLAALDVLVKQCMALVTAPVPEPLQLVGRDDRDPDTGRWSVSNPANQTLPRGSRITAPPPLTVTIMTLVKYPGWFSDVFPNGTSHLPCSEDQALDAIEMFVHQVGYDPSNFEFHVSTDYLANTITVRDNGSGASQVISLFALPIRNVPPPSAVIWRDSNLQHELFMKHYINTPITAKALAEITSV